MKLLNTITAYLLLSFLLMSCGDDPTEEGLVGTWNVTSIVVDMESSATVFGEVMDVTANGVGKNLNYSITLDGDNFTTTGEYDFDISSMIQGSTSTYGKSYKNVMGTGTYSNTENMLILDGQIFNYDIESIEFEETSGPVTFTYSINGDVLTLTQNETLTSSTFGVESEANINSVSTWKRQ